MASNEISVVGNFDFQPKLSLTQEIALLETAAQTGNTLWSPGTKDWAAIAGNSVTCSTFAEVLAVILSNPPDSIGRLNIFTHGEKTRISFRGRMMPKTTMVDVFFDDYNTGPALGMLDSDALDALNTPGKWFQVGKSNTKLTLEDVRKRFVRTNPIVIIYACHSGGDSAFLQYLSDTLDVMVDGFKPSIVCCPKFAKPQFLDRKHIGLQSCRLLNTTNYYEVLPFAANNGYVISKKPNRSARTAIPS